MRILLHPGFHKTGTSSLQRGALALQHALAPHLRVILTNDIRPAIQAARRYSVHPDTARLAAFSSAFSTLIAAVDRADSLPLLISAEALTGHIPGRKNVWAYTAGPALLGAATDALRSHFGAQTPIDIWFTTRNPHDWQRSAYWQNLRSTRLTEDFDTYRPRLHAAAQLDTIVSATRDRLSGLARVTSTPIEDCGAQPLGPLGFALDMLDIPAPAQAPLAAQNVQPKGGVEKLLELNRSSLDDTALAAAKRDLLRQFRKSGRSDIS